LLQPSCVDALAEIRDECLEVLDSPSHVQRITSLVGEDRLALFASAVISHWLISEQRGAIHRRK